MLNLDTFGDIMNELITRQHVQLLIDMPEGTQEPSVVGTGVSTVDFYILMAGIRPVFVRMIDDMGGPDALDVEGVLGDMWHMIRRDILEQLEGMKNNVRNTNAAGAGRGARAESDA